MTWTIRIGPSLLVSALLALPLAAIAGGGEVRAAETLGALSPSPHGNNKLPEGFLVQAKTGGEVYVIRGGRKSLIYRPSAATCST